MCKGNPRGKVSPSLPIRENGGEWWEIEKRWWENGDNGDRGLRGDALTREGSGITCRRISRQVARQVDALTKA